VILSDVLQASHGFCSLDSISAKTRAPDEDQNKGHGIKNDRAGGVNRFLSATRLFQPTAQDNHLTVHGRDKEGFQSKVLTVHTVLYLQYSQVVSAP
jgi:hypothetical protein